MASARHDHSTLFHPFRWLEHTSLQSMPVMVFLGCAVLPNERQATLVRDLVREKQVELLWCSTDENPADLLTKAITSSVKFGKFAKMLMGHQDSVVVAFVRSWLRCVAKA